MTLYRVLEGDSLPAIAARHYGDAARWQEIARTNGLRAPYISDREIDQYGPARVSARLLDVAAIGQQIIPLSTTARIRRGDQFVAQRRTSSGGLIFESATVADISSGVVTLSTGLQNAYPADTVVSLHPAATELVGRVARPGETLQLERITTTATVASDDRYGRDLACNDSGELERAASGDYLLIGGSANLRQQLAHRLRTEPGALHRHPDYGCAALAYVGQANTNTLRLLIQAAVAQALSADPRVDSIEEVIISVGAESITAAAKLTTRTETTSLAVEVGTL